MSLKKIRASQWVGRRLLNTIFNIFLFQKRHTKLYRKMYTKAKQYKNLYLTSAKTESLSRNFVFKSFAT